MVVIVPSRGRPDNFKRLAERWLEWDTNALLAVKVDDDDPTAEQYLDIASQLGSEIGLTIAPRKRLAPTLSEAAFMYTDFFTYIGFMGDDHLPQTRGWENILQNAMQSSNPSIVYGNDLHQGANIPTEVFMSASIIKKRGYMCPPGFVHLYLDNVWKLWGEGIERLQHFDNVIIEHLHPAGGKAEWDERYLEVNSDDMYNHDREAFNDYVTNQLDQDLASLRELI